MPIIDRCCIPVFDPSFLLRFGCALQGLGALPNEAEIEQEVKLDMVARAEQELKKAQEAEAARKAAEAVSPLACLVCGALETITPLSWFAELPSFLSLFVDQARCGVCIHFVA